MGTMRRYVVNKSFDLPSTGIKVHQGDEVLFDGINVIVGGRTIQFPGLRGAAKAGWVSLCVDATPMKLI